MDPLRVLCDLHGFFTRADAREFGYRDKDVTFAIRSGLWHRFRRGNYTFADLWAAMDEVEQHRVRSHAVLRSLGRVVALSHVSGVVEHDIPTWGIDLSRVHVTRLDGGAGRIEGDVVHHEGFCLADDVMEVNGHRVLAPGRCVLEAGSRAPGGPQLVITDGVLHQQLCTSDQLMVRFRQMERWPYMRSMHIPVRMADGRAQSPGESIGRYLFWTHRLPKPELQFQVYDDLGRLAGTCDWGWPEHRLLGEFDGRIKYGRLLKPGMEPGEVVFAEKQREDLLREITDFSMIRLVWADYDRPRLTAGRIERKLRLAG